MLPRPVSKGHCRYHRCELPRLCSVIARRGCQSADRAAAMKSYQQATRKALRRALSRSGGFVVQQKRCARQVLHGQRVWDAAQQVLARQGALYIQRHCLLRLCWYHSALLAVVWRFFFIAAGKSGKFCRHGMCEIGRRFITALPPLHSLHETLYFHRAVTAKLSSAPGGVQVR